MKSLLLASMLVGSVAAFGQGAATTLTAEEIIERSIQATGGREAMLKMTSLVGKGTMENTSTGISAATEFYAKAPDKRMTVTTIEGFGEVKQGYDGKLAWSAEPQNGVVDITGDNLAGARREAQFNGDLRWKELYPKAVVTGKEKVGARDCWVVKLTPADGKPVTRFYDAETFLLNKLITTTDSPQGPAEIAVVFSDWRDIGNGTKAPHHWVITVPGIGDLVTKYKEYKYNVEIDDAKFAKPKS